MTSRQSKDHRKHPDHHKARIATYKAVVAGLIPKSSLLQCTDCGLQAKEYDHYKGYAEEEWLSVEPVCIRCHKKRTSARYRDLHPKPPPIPRNLHWFLKRHDTFCIVCGKVFSTVRRVVCSDNCRATKHRRAHGIQARNRTRSPVYIPKFRHLTTEQVEQIRTALANNVKQATLSKRFGVSQCAISNIQKGRTHLPKI